MRIRNDLDKLSLTGKWSLREADLYDYTRELDSVDEKRVEGNWLDENGKPAELYVQRVGLSGAEQMDIGTNQTSRHYSISSGEATATYTG